MSHPNGTLSPVLRTPSDEELSHVRVSRQSVSRFDHFIEDLSAILVKYRSYQGGRPMKSVRAASPLIRELFAIADAGDLSLSFIARRIGMSDVTVGRWRLGNQSPRLLDIEAFAQVLGYEIILRKKP